MPQKAGNNYEVTSNLACEQGFHSGESRDVTRVWHAKGDVGARCGERKFSSSSRCFAARSRILSFASFAGNVELSRRLTSNTEGDGFVET